MTRSLSVFFFFQAEDGIRDLVRSRGLGDVYKRQAVAGEPGYHGTRLREQPLHAQWSVPVDAQSDPGGCLLYTSDAADERSSVDLGGRRIIKKTNTITKRPAANVQLRRATLVSYGERTATA